MNTPSLIPAQIARLPWRLLSLVIAIDWGLPRASTRPRLASVSALRYRAMTSLITVLSPSVRESA